jgi:hypothetical protein
VVALCDQRFELVVDVLYLLAGEQVGIVDACHAANEFADLVAVGAATTRR